MNVVCEEAKTKSEALNQVLSKLNAQESEISYYFKETKGGLFKGTIYECYGYLKVDVISEAEKFLKGILDGMGIDANLEVSTKDDMTTFKMYSSNNPVLIGKDGRNLEALSVIVRQFVKNLTSKNEFKIMLDVEDYKDRRVKNLERLAKNLAREVRNTKQDVEMDNMNSYERRVVHNVLTGFKNVKTESVGEEPNRHVVIKYVED